ncbi:hypothetical protein TTHERM_00537450 (macronuclear) [Tetrahymena thermophila SB210]|uniref:Uncharacterized protein n=1 Tax=Tetrahymena thermophila (strain SB210) TaxID=312017 RepID=I7M3K5_TETTS|nr:hypothetical protein TTHERM_00537450 [Tetrahymena thermophila SB210]EAS03310.3 hypothetical protein TTHERM_00537450 [Tetrahymena thermophila SB210]|eukprot:XP_001023555.3 hypothetical protein TTHERM_00537450 [Tetrahymena thermophila SB210]
MGNTQNNIVCSDCSAIQIEDASLENQRSNFQMTRLRHFSHYSRDFQVEQKYNRIKQNKPNFRLNLELIYPEYLQDKREELLVKSGIQKPQQQIDLNAETIKKSYKVGNLKITTQIKSQILEQIQINQDCTQDDQKIQERTHQVDAFLMFVDCLSDFTQINNTIDLINKYCKSEALIFLIAAKQNPSQSFLNESNNKEQIKQQEDIENKEQTQGDQLTQSKIMQQQKSNLFQSFVQSDQQGQKIQSFQSNIKNIIESTNNTDFICINYESVENMNQKFENMLSQCIYSQDSRLRITYL